MLHENYKRLDDDTLKALQPSIDRWKEQFKDKGGIRLIEVQGEDDDDKFEGIFKIPERHDLELSVKDGLTEMKSNEQLIMLCVLYPEPLVFKQILDKRWGLSAPIARKLVEISGVTREAHAKKL